MIAGDMETRLRADIAQLQRFMQDVDVLVRTSVDDMQKKIVAALGNISTTVGDAVNNLNGVVATAASALTTLTTNAASGVAAAGGQAASAMSKAMAAANSALVGYAKNMVMDFPAWIKGGIDAADAVGALAKKTGIATKDVAGLQLAFTQGGASGTVFEKSMAKLATGIAEGNSGLGALKIKTETVGVGFAKSKDVLYSVAEAFKGMEDGAQKSALAVKIFGEGGDALIPMLNDGAKGLKEMEENARALGLTISDETAESAGKFNSQLDLIKLGATGMATRIAADLLPTLTNLSGVFLETMKSSELLGFAAHVLGGFLKSLFAVALMVGEVFSQVGKTIGGMMAEIAVGVGGYGEAIGKLMNRDWSGALASAKQTYAQITAMNADIRQDKIDSMSATFGRMEKVFSPDAPEKPKEDRKKIGLKDELLREQKEREAAKKRAEENRASANKDTDNYIKSLEKERSEIGLSAAAVKQSTAEREAAKAPQESQRQRILELAAAIKKETAANEEASKAEKKRQQDAAAALEVYTNGAKKMKDEVDALARQKEVHGKSAKEVEEHDTNKLKKKLVDGATPEETTAIQQTLNLTEQRTTLRVQIEGMDALKKAGEELDKFLDPGKALDFGAALKQAFGSAGEAMNKMITVFGEYGAKEEATAKARQNATSKYASGSKELAEVTRQIAVKETKDRLGSYGDMASAAKGFFKEGSTGYKSLEAAEKTFRAVETAMAIKSMLTKTGLLEAFTGLFVTSKATEVAAETSTLAPVVAVETAKQGVFGVTALAASLALPFPACLPAFAVVAAMLAAIGVAVSGGGGGGAPVATTFEERQKTQGTGTVFGDETAKSESMAKSLELLEKNSSVELTYQNRMLQALRNIESALGGAARGIFQTAGLTSGSAFGTRDAKSESFFGSDTSTTITDTGVRFQGTLGALRTGKGSGFQYEDVTKTSDGGWFHGDSREDFTNKRALEAKALKPFTLIFDSLGDLLVGAGAQLGVDGAGLTKAIDAVVIDFGVSTRNLKGQELVDELSAGVSAAFDTVANNAFPMLADLVKVGEGLGETLVRVASNYQALDVALGSIGMAFSATGLSSLQAREDFIHLAGGIDALSDNISGFADNFLNEAERLAPVEKFVKTQMAALQLGHVDTRKEFKETVLALDVTKEGDAKTYVALMALQEAFASVVPAIDEVVKTAADIASEKKGLEAQRDELKMTPENLQQKRRSDIATQNQGLFDEVQGLLSAKALAEKNKGIDDQIQALKNAALTLAEQRAKEVVGLDESTVALIKERNALQDVVAAKALEAKNRGIEIQIMELSGNKIGALKATREAELVGLEASTAALVKERNALQDLATAKALEAKNRSIEIQIMELTGNKIGALKATRETELVGLEASTVALVKHRNALQDQALAASNAVTGANTAFNNVKAAVEQDKADLETAYQANVKAIQKRADDAKVAIDGITQRADAVRAVFEKLNTALASTVIESKAFDGAQRRSAQELLARAAATTRGGGTADIKGLDDALATIAKPSQQLFRSFEEWARDQARTGNSIAALQQNAKAEIDVAELTVAAINRSVSAIEGGTAAELRLLEKQHEDAMAKQQEIIDSAKLQLDAALGLNTGILSVTEALKQFGTALTVVKTTQSPRTVEGLYEQILGRKGEQGGLDFWKKAFGESIDDGEVADFTKAAKPELEAKEKGAWQQFLSEHGIPSSASGGGAPPLTSVGAAPVTSVGAAPTLLTVDQLYQNILHRRGETAGLTFWKNAFGASVDAVEELEFRKAALPELQARENGTLAQFLRDHGVPGYADGGQFEGGVRLVGENGPELEATGPARIYNAGQTRSLLVNAGSGDLAGEIRELRMVVQSQAEALIEISSNTGKTAGSSDQLAKQFNNVSSGGNNLRTKAIA
ncbi:hypothetical protein [Massilia aquatica]|uniref:DUF4214 domain-containing protein n=1 Tax=Massilia aquatica TaxID=2609000 RepID=A0ABX0MCS8_9BURK|nr:hypothetical protein [Massilia aquatica]NHZ41821.1 hypothetical protein [Massilia aquatica]